MHHHEMSMERTPEPVDLPWNGGEHSKYQISPGVFTSSIDSKNVIDHQSLLSRPNLKQGVGRFHGAAAAGLAHTAISRG
jgi:hypothetical protein